jgi:hypothetical protein
MNSRIVAGFLAIFATGLMVAPVETAARGGGGFVGGRAMPMAGGFRGPMVRPGIAPVRPLVAPMRPAAAPAGIRAAPFARVPFARVPFARAPFARAPFGQLRHHRFFAGGLPVAIYGDAGPWYSGYLDPSYYYGNYGAPQVPPVYNYPPTASPAYTAPVGERVVYVVAPRPGCTTQTYNVPSERGGERSINVVRC